MGKERPTVRRALRRDDGVSALEFGLLLPVLLVILLGTMDWGHALFVYLTMANASREGARVGVTYPEDQAASQAVATTNGYLASAGIAGVAVNATTPSTADPTVRVTTTLAPFDPLLGFVPTPGSLQASAAMRWELAPVSP